MRIKSPVRVICREPTSCNDNEIADFKALVLAGGEVTPGGLDQRIRAAVGLVFLSEGRLLRGIAALKSPLQTYRKEVFAKSGVPLAEEEYPFELGWVFIIPSARGKKLSLKLVQAAVTVAGGCAVFATSRTDNLPMHATLVKCGFLPAGDSYRSTRGSYELQLFVRNATPKVTRRG